MSIPWLADVLRAAGLTVVEHADWKTHDRPGTWEPRYGIVHATAAPRSQSDETQVRIIRDGRSDLIGPIANACVDRLGRWHVLSAGRCNTTITGTAGPYEGMGNTYALGVEACNDNVSEPWPASQYEAYYRGWAAICRRLGWAPERLRGHKEHTPGHKTDPVFSMTQFRAAVARVLSGEEDDMATLDEVKNAVVSGLHSALKQANERDTPTGRQLGDYIASLLSLRIDPVLKKLDALNVGLGANLTARLDAILAAAADDSDTTVVMSEADRAALVAQLVAAIDIPSADELADAVADEAAARLEG